MVERIASEVGAQHAVGTRLEIRGGRYTGHSLAPVCIDENKARLVRQHFEDNNLQVDLSQSFAYADSITDLGLLEMVGNPTAVYPDKTLNSIARQRGWRILPA
jgi:phosphoserine phosphatase